MARKIEIRKIVNNTGSNSEGYQLFLQLCNFLEHDETIHLSLKESTPFSTSFLNSSFGLLVEKYGIKKVRDKIKLTDYKLKMAMSIKSYLENLEQLYLA